MADAGPPPKQGPLRSRATSTTPAASASSSTSRAASRTTSCRKALQVLLNLEHRGACGCEKNTGDGAGILFRSPHEFLGAKCQKLRHRAAGAGEYGVGHGVPAHRRARRAPCERLFEQIVARGRPGSCSAGATCRPTTPGLGATAARAEPVIRQVFIGRATGDRRRALAFERKLYVIRKRVERRASKLGPSAARTCSTSPACRARRSSTRACSSPTQVAASSPTCTIPPSRPPWRWSTRASAPTPSRPGSAPIRTATSPTTARSTRCAATSTGCTPARAMFAVRPVRRRHQEDPAGHRRPTAATRPCSTTRSSCWC